MIRIVACICKIRTAVWLPGWWLFLGSVVLGFLVAREAVGASPNLDDLAVTGAVKQELISDRGVEINPIDVHTVEGIVTLKGIVCTLIEKERSVRIAETVRGVRAVIDRLTVVAPVNRTDMEIEKAVEEALLLDAATDAYEIRVACAGGVASLRGEVDSWQEKELVESVVKGVKGVKGVLNLIKVDIKSDRPDEEISAEVRQALHWDVLVDDSLIRVTVSSGQVSLTGTVGSAAEKRWAARVAMVAGVKSIETADLKVEAWQRQENLRKNKYVMKPDRKIQKAVEDALLYDPRVFSFDINVEVSDGVVTLRGEVDNLKARWAAALDARHTVGVAYVKNRIRVRPGEGSMDLKIKQRVERALSNNPLVERHDIAVEVNNGIVDLEGWVETPVERGEAEDAAARIRGVVSVDNNIKVSGTGKPLIYNPYVDRNPPLPFRMPDSFNRSEDPQGPETHRR